MTSLKTQPAAMSALLKPVSAESFLEYFYGLSLKYVFLALEEEIGSRFLQRVSAEDPGIRDYVVRYLDDASSNLSKQQELVLGLRKLF